MPGVPCILDGEECVLDFEGVDQLFCNGTCSPVDPIDCQDGDADLLCRVKTRNPNAKAVGWEWQDDPNPAPGFSCAEFDADCIEVGPWPEWGVDQVLCFNPTTIPLNGDVVYVPTCEVP